MGCSGTARVRGWCDKHYQRWIFHDNPEAPIRGKEHHGMSESAIYPVWAAMIGRCTKANDPGYKYYGGRGIRVSDRWLNSFANFYQDMGMRPTDRHTLERKDVNGNYEPGNVVWATPTEQARNKRINVKNKSGYAGVWYSKKCKKWRVSIGLNGKTIHIGMYKTIEEAISARQIAEKDYWI